MGIYLKSIPSNISIFLPRGVPTSLGHPWAFASLTDPPAEDIRHGLEMNRSGFP
jgi:hypothetical protein